MAIKSVFLHILLTVNGYKSPRDEEAETINFHHDQAHIKMVEVQKVN